MSLNRDLNARVAAVLCCEQVAGDSDEDDEGSDIMSPKSKAQLDKYPGSVSCALSFAPTPA